MITGIIVYEAGVAELRTDEPGLRLEWMGGAGQPLASSMTLVPGVYRVSSAAPITVRAADVDRVQDGVPPPRAIAQLQLDEAAVAAFLQGAAQAVARNKRALVVGSETFGLEGVVNDCAAMAAFLRGRGFEVDARINDQATREGILGGYEQLIKDTNAGDAAVFYYSGHGALARLPDSALRSAQHIVPFDYEASTEALWRGITAWELSVLQQRLTGKTKNVVTILDCCHASQMSRDAAKREARPRALAHPTIAGLDRRLAQLRKDHPDVLALLDPLGNPDAVRLVACAQDESAYEFPDDAGKYHGLFTLALLDVMGAVGAAPITWQALGEGIRARVLRTFPTQRPDIEGKSRRRLFELIEEDERGATSIHSVGDKLMLGAGQLAEVTVGDVYGIMAVGALAYAKGDALGEVTVVAVGALTSTVMRAVAGARFPVDAVAFPIRRQAPKRLVVLDAAGASVADRAALEHAIDAARTLAIAKPGERGVATLLLADGRLAIADEIGPLFAPVPLSTGLLDAVRNVANLGVAQRLRELDGAPGVSPAEVDVELGLFEVGEHRALPAHGSALGLLDRIDVRLTNRSKRPLFCHIFNLGVRGKVSLLSQFAPSGIPLAAGEVYTLDGAPGTVPDGLGLVWPDGLVADEPRVDELMVIVTSKPASLDRLTTSPAVTRGGGGSKLELLLDQVQTGRTRDTTTGAALDGYAVKRVTFMLHPRPVAIGGVTFQIDENPTGMAGAGTPAAWSKGVRKPPKDAPRAISIQLDELVVLDNHARFRADVRIDALITTRSRVNQPYAPRTWTEQFKKISDNEKISLAHPVLFYDEVEDFVDISLFVSRDNGKGTALADLFAQQTGSAEFQQAAAALLVAADSVGATPWVAAVGASAVLTRMAYRLVLGLRNESIGLYRTSFLAGDRFGIGRHPVEGRYRAQDFEFALSIKAVT